MNSSLVRCSWTCLLVLSRRTVSLKGSLWTRNLFRAYLAWWPVVCICRCDKPIFKSWVFHPIWTEFLSVLFFAIFVGGLPSSSDDPESAMLACFDLGYGIVAILYSAKFIASDWQLLRKKPNWKVKLFIEKCQNSENTVYKSIVSRLFAVEPRPGRDNLNIKFNFNCSNKFFLLNNWCRIPEKRVLHYLKFPGTLVIHRRGSITVLRKF